MSYAKSRHSIQDEDERKHSPRKDVEKEGNQIYRTVAIAVTITVIFLSLTAIAIRLSNDHSCSPGTRESPAGGCVLNHPFPSAVDTSISDSRGRPCANFAGFACGGWRERRSRREFADEEYEMVARSVTLSESAGAWAWAYDVCVAAYAGEDSAATEILKNVTRAVLDAEDGVVADVLWDFGIDVRRCEEAGQSNRRATLLDHARCRGRRWRNATEAVLTEMRAACGSRCRARMESASEAKKNALWCAAWSMGPYVPVISDVSAEAGCAGWTMSDKRPPKTRYGDMRQLPPLSRSVATERYEVCEESLMWHAPSVVHGWLYSRADGVEEARSIVSDVMQELAIIAEENGLSETSACILEANIIFMGEDIPKTRSDSYVGTALSLIIASRNGSSGAVGSAAPRKPLCIVECRRLVLSPRLLHPPFFSSRYDIVSSYSVLGGIVAEYVAGSLFPEQEECPDAVQYLSVLAAYRSLEKRYPRIKEDTEDTRKFFAAYAQLRCGERDIGPSMAAISSGGDRPFSRAFGCGGAVCVPRWD